MNIADFDLSKTTFELKIAFSYSPKVLNQTINRRPNSGFLYIKKGSYRYYYEKSSFVADANSIIYLPSLSKPYSYEITALNGQAAQSMQIEMEILNADTKEPVAFSEHPVIVAQPAPLQTEEIFASIIAVKSRTDLASQLILHAELHRLLALYFGAADISAPLSLNHKTIAPAVRYIQENYKKEVRCSDLARLCSISETHLRRVFKTELGMSPLNYRNQLILEDARTLLKSREFNVCAIAEFLGFNDLYSFSHFFKKETGMSPMHYLKKLEFSAINSYDRGNNRSKEACLMKLVITVSRRYGTGASLIAGELSRQLGLPVYDKAYIEHEMEGNTFADESEIIRQLARKPCIILGRCASEILKEQHNVFNIYVSAAKEDRIQRIMKKEKLPYEEAKVMLEKNDRARADYYYEHTGKVWGDVNNYNMILDTTTLGIENCADIVMKYFRKMEYI